MCPDEVIDPIEETPADVAEEVVEQPEEIVERDTSWPAFEREPVVEPEPVIEPAPEPEPVPEPPKKSPLELSKREVLADSEMEDLGKAYAIPVESVSDLTFCNAAGELFYLEQQYRGNFWFKVRRV
jgi:hypothetical protein